MILPRRALREIGQVLFVATVLIALTALWHRRAPNESGVQPLTAMQREAFIVAPRRPLVFPGEYPDTIMFFIDHRCAYCAALYPEFVRESLPYGVEIRFALANRTSLSAQAAIAAECARKQGKFHAYNYALFSKRDSIGGLSWQTFANAAGVVDVEGHERCIASRSTAAQINEDIILGEQLGISSTPVVVFENKRYVGPVRIMALLADIARARRSSEN